MSLFSKLSVVRDTHLTISNIGKNGNLMYNSHYTSMLSLQ